MFYFKIALQNVRKSSAIFGPFVLSSMVMYVLLSAIIQIMLSPVGRSMGTGVMSLTLGLVVMGILSIIMEIYSYQFLITQRAKEFALYNILGMNKKKVSLIASLELLLIYLGLIVVGSGLSAVFSNVLYLIFVKITGFGDLHFKPNIMGFLLTATLFAGIFFILVIIATWTIGRSKPLMLMEKAQIAEKEPKGNAFLAFLGILSIGGGYYLSITSQATSLALIWRFFIAVLFVIVGTYLFYISFVAWYLKRRRANPTYYYHPKHFIATSQMLFRMKQHAVGLANISLLAVMAFVTIATTTSLHLDMVQKTQDLFQRSTTINVDVENRQQGEQFFRATLASKFPQAAQDSLAILSFFTDVIYDGEETLVINKSTIDQPDFSKMTFLYIVTQDDYRAMGNQLGDLAENEVAFWSPVNRGTLGQVRVGDQQSFQVRHLNKANLPELNNMVNGALMVVANDQVLDAFISLYQNNHPQGYPNNLTYTIYSDLNADQVAEIAAKDRDNYLIESDQGQVIGRVALADTYTKEILAFTGGFLFTGFMLGFSFLLGAALIIYYKQYAEGMADKTSYHILQQVGMSQSMIKSIIRSQMMTVFFMPLGLAVLHFVVALVMLKQMLSLFNVSSSMMIYSISAITVLVIGLLYYLIYRWTSVTYYRIVKR